MLVHQKYIMLLFALVVATLLGNKFIGLPS